MDELAAIRARAIGLVVNCGRHRHRRLVHQVMTACICFALGVTVEPATAGAAISWVGELAGLPVPLTAL